MSAALKRLFRWRPETPGGDPSQSRREALLADYVAAEDALRAFTDQNFGRLCAICARWTLFAARANAGAAGLTASAATAGEATAGEATAGNAGGTTDSRRPVNWRLSSWVTNCCNANHALESMSEDSLAGIVASREEGQEWWRRVKRANGAPCAALTADGCHLTRGRPELCNKYFCEAVRDYLWLLGGDQHGAHLAASLDELQRRWGRLYATYATAIAEREERPRRQGRLAVRRAAGWDGFFPFLAAFDKAIGDVARQITAGDVTGRLFKVEGEAGLYEPFFAAEVAAIGGRIRRTDQTA